MTMPDLTAEQIEEWAHSGIPAENMAAHQFRRACADLALSALARSASQGNSEMTAQTKGPNQYRKKPVVIEAVRWTGANIEEVLSFFGDISKLPVTGAYIKPGIGHCPPMGTLDIPTLEGVMTAQAGDWIIKEPFPTDNRKFYPCKPDIFALTYELAAPAYAAEPVTELSKEAVEHILGHGVDNLGLGTEGAYKKAQRFYARLNQLVAAPPPDFQAGLEVPDCGCPPGKCCARRKTDEDTCRMTPFISALAARKEG